MGFNHTLQKEDALSLDVWKGTESFWMEKFQSSSEIRATRQKHPGRPVPEEKHSKDLCFLATK